MKLLSYINEIIYKYHPKKNNGAIGDNILAVSNTGFGDTILSTPAIVTLKNSFPRAKIIFLVNKKIYPLFDGFKYADNIIRYTGGYINLFKIIWLCRAQKINTIFLFHANSPEDIFIAMLSGAKNILKYTHNKQNKYKQLFMNEPFFKSAHNIDRKLDLVRLFNPRDISTRMIVSDKFYVNNNDCNIPLPKERTIIGVQLGTQEVYKIWPIENVISLSNKLLKKGVFLVYFGATKLELTMMRTLLKNIKSDSIMDLCGKTALDELPYILKKINLLITNDTGIMHLAIAMQTKTLSLFSPSPFNEVGAYQDKELHSHIQKDGFFEEHLPKQKRSQAAMKMITVDEVFIKTMEIL